MAEQDSSDFKLYRYDPSMGAAVVFTALFLAASCIHSFQLFRTKAWSLVPFVIGGHMEWIGYIGRAMSAHEAPNFTLGPYIMQTLLLLVAPALYAASIYMILGRIIRLTNGEAYSIIPIKWLTKVFVVGDVISFIAQGAGGGIMASGTLEAMHNGERIIIVGLVVQILFFSLFTVVAVVFHLRMSRSRKAAKDVQPWLIHQCALYAGSLLILVRSVFRLLEYAQGNDGYLITHEIYLYIFDALLMISTMLVFMAIHPSEITALLNGHGATAVRRVFNFYQVY